MTHAIIIIVFAMIYKYIYNLENKSFSNMKKMTWFDSVYYSTITHSTVGFGDVYPQTRMSKLACMTHVLLVFFIGFFEINRII